MDVKRLSADQNLTAGMSLQPEGQQVFVPTVLAVSAASATSAVTTVSSISVDGGQMGPNGLLTIEIVGQFSNTAGSDRFLSVGPGPFGIATVTSDNVPTANSGTLYYMGTVWNLNNEAVNVGWGYVYIGFSSQVAHVSTSTPGTSSIDTSQDITGDIKFQLTGVGAIGSVSWLIYGLRVTTIYAPGY